MPFILLTAKDAIEDKVRGLDSGADDYRVKPFFFIELMARIRALIRMGKTHYKTQLTIADLSLDLATHNLSWPPEIKYFRNSIRERCGRLCLYALRPQCYCSVFCCLFPGLINREIWEAPFWACVILFVALGCRLRQIKFNFHKTQQV